MVHSRAMLTNGTLPSAQLDAFSVLRPFTQQLDVVFPTSDGLEKELASMQPTYCQKRCTLSAFFDFASKSLPSSNIMALPCTSECDDTWCIDPRGVLTLCVSKPLYEQLGLVGKRLPFKGCSEQYVIRILVRQESESVAVRARQQAALKLWDALRENENGPGEWHVLYCQRDMPPGAVVHVSPRLRHSAQILVPTLNLASLAEESAEEWDERISALFEWVGMVCLGAQRLEAHDRVDPYVAVYEAPDPCHISDTTHISWRGLMHPTFVQRVLDTVMSHLVSATDPHAFVAVTRHGCGSSPVGAIPSSSLASDRASFDTARDAPLRAPQADAEDTGCLILQSGHNGRFALAESIGRWDARWG